MESHKTKPIFPGKLLANINSKQAILAFSCIVFSLIGPLIFWASDRHKQGNFGNRNPPVEKYFSSGERVLVTLDDSPDKEMGVEKLRAGKYEEAIAYFSSTLKRNRNDPESWIYLNNARALAAGDVVKVAVAVPIGNNVNVAKEILRGVAQYQEEVNRDRGVGGKLLHVTVVNDNNDPELAKYLAAAIAKNDSILAVVGHQSSDVSVAVAPIYESSRIVAISPTSYAREMSGIGKYIFRTTPSSRVFADTLAKYAVETQRHQRFAICSDSKSRASQSFKEDFTAAIYAQGAQITNTVCDFSAPDFNPDEIATKATTDGATSLLVAPGVERIKQAIAMLQANKGRLSAIGTQSMYTFETLQQGNSAANGITLTVPWEPSSAKGTAYAKEALQLWGGLGNWRTAMAYDSAKSIGEALATASSRQELQRRLSNPGFLVRGATGTIQFLPTGDRNQKGTLVKILPGKRSGVGYDFVALKPEQTSNPSSQR